MSDRLRMTGLASGMDTQSIVEQLVEVKSYKKTDLKNEQTKLGWKQEAWKDLNKKMYSFYTNKLGEMRFEGFFNKKTANIVDSSIAKVSAEGTAVNGTQALAVKQLAKTHYITSKNYGNDVKGTTTVKDAMGLGNSDIPKTLSVNGKTIEIDENTTMKQLAEGFASAGLNASFDESTHRLFISAKESGKDGKFDIEVLDGEGNPQTDADFIKKMGLSEAGGASVVEGQDAEIILNGATFTSNTNNFSINGLSITATKVSEKDAQDKYITTNVSVDTDVDGIYDSIKDFFKEYNELINEMSKLYNADSARDYKVLSDEEKDAMSDEEVEKWEQKIKDSLLRRDDNLNTALEMFKSGMMASFDINGTKFSLASFGIGTMSYFEAADNEKYALHIDGNPDDEKTS